MSPCSHGVAGVGRAEGRAGPQAGGCIGDCQGVKRGRLGGAAGAWLPGAGRRVLGWLGALRPSKLLVSGLCREMTGLKFLSVSFFL